MQKVQSFKPISKEIWSQIALTIDENSYCTLYINGAKDSGGTINSVDYDAIGTPLIGCTDQDVVSGQFNKNFVGYIDEVMIIKNVISEGEIYQLYKWYITN